jgi:hypothetical protein
MTREINKIKMKQLLQAVTGAESSNKSPKQILFGGNANSTGGNSTLFSHKDSLAGAGATGPSLLSKLSSKSISSF